MVALWQGPDFHRRSWWVTSSSRRRQRLRAQQICAEPACEKDPMERLILETFCLCDRVSLCRVQSTLYGQQAQLVQLSSKAQLFQHECGQRLVSHQFSQLEINANLANLRSRTIISDLGPDLTLGQIFVPKLRFSAKICSFSGHMSQFNHSMTVWF